MHNFYELTEIEDVKKRIQSDILESFPIDKKTRQEKEVYYEDQNEHKRVLHLVFAAENSEAGNFYNENSLD